MLLTTKFVIYPRRYLNDYSQRHKGKEAVVATTEWELENQDISAVEKEFGEGCLKSTNVTISKSYEQTNTTWVVPIDVSKAIGHLIDQSNFNATEKAGLEKF